jgi:shikimate kinase
VVLVGLPGAGKTTVGRLVAGLLKAPFADFDTLIEARAGKTVSRIFSEDGEAAFRALEAALGAERLAGPPSILSPGGGFLMDPESRQRALAAGYVVYLETSPHVAAARVPPGMGRPLLDGPDQVARLERIHAQREASYLEAQQRVTTDGRSAEEVASLVAELARAEAGW